MSMRIKKSVMVVLTFWSTLPCLVNAQSVTQQQNDYGEFGIIQTPTARFNEDGGLFVGYAHVLPYKRFVLNIQPLPWLEGSFNYARFLYDVNDDHTYNDRGFNIKVRIMEESRAWPQLAIGIRDVGGTGIFAGEYLVASRRYYNYDFSFGVGWGSLGTRGWMGNPFNKISDIFKQKDDYYPTNVGTLSRVPFAGNTTSLFGGVRYAVPEYPVTLKMEYDPDHYKTPRVILYDIPSTMPVNFGIDYQPFNWLRLSLSLERGNTVALSAGFATNLNKDTGIQKMFDPPPSPVPPRKTRHSGKKGDNHAAQQRTTVLRMDNAMGAVPGSADLSTPSREGAQEREAHVSEVPLWPDREQAKAVFEALEKEDGIRVESLRPGTEEMTIFFSQNRHSATPKAMGRLGRRWLSLPIPDTMVMVTFVQLESGVENGRVTLLRKDLEQLFRFEKSPEEVWSNARITGPRPEEGPEIFNKNNYPDFNFHLEPAFRQHVGGWEVFYAMQLGVYLKTGIRFNRHLAVNASYLVNLFHTFDSFNGDLGSDSVLPHVRSDVRHYLAKGASALHRLSVDYMGNLGSSVYYRLSAGIMEEMYGGLGGEVLYRPHGATWAVGAEVNHVRKRGFDGGFDFLDYETTTEHIIYHQDLPWHNMAMDVRMGRYLAGDIGSTWQFSRQFDNGVQAGFFFTRTNVSAEEFGEGSFDKGVFVNIPYELFSPSSSRRRGTFVFRPLSRDGGQMVGSGESLYGLTVTGQPKHLSETWHSMDD